MGVLAALCAPAAASAQFDVQSVTPWLSGTGYATNASVTAWSPNGTTVYFNSNASGTWAGYSASPNGTNIVPVTAFSGAGGIIDVSPSGQYLLEDGPEAGTSGSEPGLGTNADVYLESANRSATWDLTNIAAAGNPLSKALGQPVIGTMWPRFDHTGNQVVFSAMLNTNNTIGSWALVVATVTWTNGTPSLTHFQFPLEGDAIPTGGGTPATFFEPYGFTPNNQGIVFASDLNPASSTDAPWYNSQIYTVNLSGTGLTRISTQDPTFPDTAFFNDYDEFAYFTPDDSTILYGSNYQGDNGLMDLWEANPTGTDPQQLTYFGPSWDSTLPEYISPFSGSAGSVGSLAFNPDNSDQFLLSVEHLAVLAQNDYYGSYLVTLAQASAGGLNETFYPNLYGTNPLSTTSVSSPSEPFKWVTAPAAGLANAGPYRVSWTGTLTPRVTGTYEMCTIADGGMQVLLNGVKVVNGWNGDEAKQVCAQVPLTAGTVESIEVDYWHWDLLGTAAYGFGELTWELPGQTTQSIIPLADLQP